MALKLNPFTGNFDYTAEADEINTALLISDAAVIAAITNENNWNLDFTDPGGILAQITAGQYYFDNTTKNYYYYNGTVLFRMQTNII